MLLFNRTSCSAAMSAAPAHALLAHWQANLNPFADTRVALCPLWHYSKQASHMDFKPVILHVEQMYAACSTFFFP